MSATPTSHLTPIADALSRDDDAPDSLLVLSLKGMLYAAAVALYLRTLATPAAIYAGWGALSLALLTAWFSQAQRWRMWVGLSMAAVALALAAPLGQWFLSSGTGGSARGALLWADATYFSLLTFGTVLALRTLSHRWRPFSVLEVGFVVGSVVYTFLQHRNRAMTEPRFLSDWALSQGYDPGKDILLPLGLVVTLASLTMLLRAQRATKLLSSVIALALLTWGAYELLDKIDLPKPVIDTNGLGLTSDESKDGKDGQGNADGKGGGGGGNSNNPFDGPSKPPDVIVPVAIAVLHDDHKPLDDLFYFRQQVLSRYNGHHLVNSLDADFDADVITRFPTTAPVTAAPVQDPAFHLRVPTSMFLLTDHPQPLALTNSVDVSPLENPNPDHFVAAYKATSLTLSMDYSRLIGRKSIPDDWTQAQRDHYLEIPDDPRYAALSDIIVRDLDPRYADDDIMRAFVIKRYLEHEGFYTRKERHADDVDPAASFLFGSMRGYCVHFAHSAVYLLRSQGIAARVALGYAVDGQMRRGGSAVMITNDRAHAWPEIYVDGVGWITFDIYPERSDEPPGRPIDQSLENVLGELARKDKTGGKAADPNQKPFRMPWRAIGLSIGGFIASLLVLAYLAKLTRLLLLPLLTSGAARERWLFRATLDRLSDLGLQRAEGETRERYARRLQNLTPALDRLTSLHLRRALGPDYPPDPAATGAAAAEVRRELRRALPLHRRALGWLNPIGWWFSR
jgi:protein-glutamine gamma-glutamyltransferase